MTTTSDLARELGAIASGEAASDYIEQGGFSGKFTGQQTQAFAAGIERLIDERIALVRDAKRNPPSDDVRPVAIGDTFCRVGGAGVPRVYEVVEIDVGDWTALIQGDGVWSNSWTNMSVLCDPEKWERIRAVDVPKAADPVEIGDRFRGLDGDSYLQGITVEVERTDGDLRLVKWGNNSTWRSAAELMDPERFDCLPRLAPAKEPGHPEPHCVPAPVKVGDTFLSLITNHDHAEAGDVSRVGTSHRDGWWLLMENGLGFAATESELLDSGEFQRVPTGYTLPTVMQCLDAIRQLIAARDAMRADPTTGTKGIDDCIAEMMLLAGMVTP